MKKAIFLILCCVVAAGVFGVRAAADATFQDKLRNREEGFVFLNAGAPIGYMVTAFTEERADFDSGDQEAFRVESELILWSVGRKGGEQAQRFKTNEVIGPDLRLKRFATIMNIGSYDMRMTGALQGEKLTYQVVQNGRKKQTITAKAPEGCIPVSVLPIYLSGFDPNDGKELTICTIEYQAGSVAVGRAMVGAPVRADPPEGASASYVFRYQVRGAGFDGTITTDPDGYLLEEVQPKLGLTARRITDNEMASLDRLRGWDPTRSSVLPANMMIARPDALSYMKIQLVWSGVPVAKLSFSSDIQKPSGLINKKGWNRVDLIIKHQPAARNAASAAAPAKANPNLAVYLGADDTIKADDPLVRAWARSITEGAAGPEEAATLIEDWIYKEIEPDPASWNSATTASDVLRLRRGTAKHKAILFAAMARSIGIPTKIVAGKAYSFGTFVTHYWNELHVSNSWRTYDASDPYPEEPPVIVKIAESAGAAAFNSIFPAMDNGLFITIKDIGG